MLIVVVRTVYPLIFHSIPDEIPEASRSLVTRLYQLWMVLGVTLLVNMAACIVLLIAGMSDAGADLGSSIGYILSLLTLHACSKQYLAIYSLLRLSLSCFGIGQSPHSSRLKIQLIRL